MTNGQAVWSPLPEEQVESPSDPTPEIRDILIVPEAITVAPGSAIQYTVEMDIIGDLSTEVIWSIKGNYSEGTYITQDGILYISEDETSKLITVRAVSALDSSKSGRATVAVDEEAEIIPMVTVVQVIPADATVIRGKSLLLQAIVSGINLNDHSVSWSLIGNNNTETYIDEEGILHINEMESASVLVITATSNADNTKSGTSVISVIPEELAEDVWKIEKIRIVPDTVECAAGYSVRFVAIVEGVNNPPQDVIWRVIASDESLTDVSHISNEGVLYVSSQEPVGTNIQVQARSMYDPAFYSDIAQVTVLDHDTPGFDEVIVTGVAVSPEMVEVGTNSQVVFKAVVLGRNNPSQEVKWTLSGNKSAKTVISAMGVLTIAADEVSKVLIVRATSVADTNYFVSAYVTISEAKSTPATGIPDVPEAPLEQTYVRKRDKSGKAIWEKTPEDVPAEPLGADYVRSRDEDGGAKWKEAVIIKDVPDTPGKEYIRRRNEDGTAEWAEAEITGGRGGYLGTYDTYQDLVTAELPERVNDDDYAIVTKDETHNQFPAIYVLKEQPDGTYKWEFDVVLGRPFILGDKLDILYVLDNEVHSTLLKDIEVIADFDTTEKRWELAQSEAAWKLVTELHSGFWNMIKHNRDRFKAIVAMDRNDGSVKMYLTCFTDRREFIIPFPEEGSEALAVIEEDIENPVPIKDTLKWTNTVQNGAFLTAMDDTQYVEYIFDWDSFTLTILKQQPLEQEADEPAVSPWATVVGEYTMLKNGEVIGPLEGVTDPTGYLWTANRESFMIGSAGDGTQMFCYNIDDDTYFIFDVPAGPKANYHFATDLNERYFMFWITSTTAVWGDRKTQEVKQIRWDAQGYSGLSEPGQFTRPSISVDGKYYLHTSTNNSTPMFTTFSFETGRIVTEAPDNGTSQSAIGLNDAQRVMSNTPTG